jgi:murein tripeptide amidase MpaA
MELWYIIIIQGGYITHKEFKNIIKNLTQYEIIKVEEIGKTYNNNSIDLIKIETNNTNNAILFTGLHHAREPVSTLMNIYVILYLINKYSENDLAVKELLSNVNVYFIPMINVDGYIKNNELYEIHKNLDMCMIRKNRRNNCDSQDNSGVDLNRNYNFKFNNDEQGSSGNQCQEDYRGEYPFSENETRAVKEFIDKHDNIKIAFNYHSWGNLLIIPFNYLDSYNELLSYNYTKEYNLYQDFLNEAGFPTGIKFGNGMKAIG